VRSTGNEIARRKGFAAAPRHVAQSARIVASQRLLEHDYLVLVLPKTFAGERWHLVALHARSAVQLINEARIDLISTHYPIEYKAFNANPL
jgi:hypothetical protein